MIIKAIEKQDTQAVCDIYNYYIANTIATFEEEIITEATMSKRIAAIFKKDLPWLVAKNVDNNINKNTVTGFAYASTWKERSAYRFSVEVTVYLSPNYTGAGLGSKLYKALFDELKSRSIINVLGCISLPNPQSVALHEKFNLQKVAHFKEVGFKFNQWVDVGYWQGQLNEAN